MQAVVTEVEDADLAAIAAWFAAQTPPEPSEPEGDAARGATLFAERGCGACHQAAPPEGLTPPHLAAQHEAYLSKQLTDFRDGRRANDPDGVMRAQAAALTDAEIAALAAYLASSPRTPP
jgi:cytochrome c553